MPVDPISAVVQTLGSLILGFGSGGGQQERESFGSSNIIGPSQDLEEMIRALLGDIANAPPPQISDIAARNAAPFVFNQPQQRFAGVDIGINPATLGFGLGTGGGQSFFPQAEQGAPSQLAGLFPAPVVRPPVGPEGPELTTPRRAGRRESIGRRDPSARGLGRSNVPGSPQIPGFTTDPGQLEAFFDVLRGFTFGVGGDSGGGKGGGTARPILIDPGNR